MTKNTTKVDLFWGYGAVEAPPGEGLAKHWNWLKAQTGNNHPGAMLPFGWVTALPYSGAYPTGYGRNGNSCEGKPPQVSDTAAAYGITHFHPSGTGYVGEFYNYFLVTPCSSGCDCREISELKDEYASCGYFSGKLVDYGVDFELTCGKFAALHRYYFAEDSGKIKVDITQLGLRITMGAYSEKIGAFHGEAVDNGIYCGFVNAHGALLYYAVCCKGGLKRQKFINGVITFELDGTQAECVLAFSLVSEAEALERVKLAAEKGFDAHRSAAAQAWEELLGKICVNTASDDKTKLFYSALYHSFVKPCDAGSEFIDFQTMWDIYRTQLPLTMITAPETARRMLLSIMATIEKKGFFPCCYMMSMLFAKHDVQATALSVYTFCDGFFSGVLTKADYPAMKSAIEKVFATASLEGKSPPHTLDLAGAYHAAALIAKECGDSVTAEMWEKESSVWKKVYEPATGLLISNADYYEGTYWNYSFRPHVDMAERVALAGGQEGFEKLLDKFFGFGCTDEYSCTRPLIDHRFEGMNNESDMETPAAYLWCGRVDKQALIHDTIRKNMFLNGSGGCPGNNDSGALSSWYVLSVLGIYPLTGTGMVLLTSPEIKSAEITLARGVLKIEVERESASSIYPVEYTFNGRKLDGAYLPWSELASGGVLKFVLKDEPDGSFCIPDWL
ncbi:MAG: hypothetical protein E7051_01560 [Lentisphaerae bacterium]|nr:hypothetical protein [Lentisphaerota bacterium]